MNHLREKGNQLADDLQAVNESLYSGGNIDHTRAVKMIRELVEQASPAEARVTALADAARVALGVLATQQPQTPTDYTHGWRAACRTIANGLFEMAKAEAQAAPADIVAAVEELDAMLGQKKP